MCIKKEYDSQWYYNFEAKWRSEWMNFLQYMKFNGAIKAEYTQS